MLGMGITTMVVGDGIGAISQKFTRVKTIRLVGGDSGTLFRT